MLRKTRQTRPLESMRRSLIHSEWLENGTFIRSQIQSVTNAKLIPKFRPSCMVTVHTRVSCRPLKVREMMAAMALLLTLATSLGVAEAGLFDSPLFSSGMILQRGASAASTLSRGA